MIQFWFHCGRRVGSSHAPRAASNTMLMRALHRFGRALE
jgi:hypothetical protein